MIKDQELKLQAYLDNELSPEEAREVANCLARDREAVATLHALRCTRQALVQFESGVRLPESREFYWSKIRRQIEHAESSVHEPAQVSFLARLRRFLIPASAVALLVLTGLVLTRDGKLTRPVSNPIETALADPKAFTYSDYVAGTTLVWLSYPADRESGENASVEEMY